MSQARFWRLPASWVRARVRVRVSPLEHVAEGEVLRVLIGLLLEGEDEARAALLVRVRLRLRVRVRLRLGLRASEPGGSRAPASGRSRPPAPPEAPG